MANQKQDKKMTVTFEDAKLIFKNFGGREGPFNKPGDRSFAVVIPDPKVAQAMIADGWNVKYPNPRDGEEEDTRDPYLPVAVRFDILPPRIFLITSKARTPVNEAMCEVLDWTDIRTVDLIVNASAWTVRDKSGIKAYLKTMYVTVDEDELDKKYAEGE